MTFFHPRTVAPIRRRPIRAVILAMLIMAATLVTVVQSAPTASAAQSCKLDNVCIFTGTNYTGWGLTVPAYRSGTCMNLADWYGGTYNNSIRSYVSNWEYGTFYADSWCHGAGKGFTGSSDGSRSKNLLNWGSRISSIYFS